MTLTLAGNITEPGQADWARPDGAASAHWHRDPRGARRRADVVFIDENGGGAGVRLRKAKLK
jgi:hypothetical protein